MTLTPGATSWVHVTTFGAKLPWCHSNRKWVSKHWTVILRRKFCENSIFTGELGDALENKKMVLKEQQKEKQFDGL